MFQWKNERGIGMGFLDLEKLITAEQAAAIQKDSPLPRFETAPEEVIERGEA